MEHRASYFPFASWGLTPAFPHSVITRTRCGRNNAVLSHCGEQGIDLVGSVIQ